RFPDGWPSVRFLLNDRAVMTFSPETGLPLLDGPAGPTVIYAWPYGSLDFLPDVAEPAQIDISPGPLARGDLEPEPYSLFTRYAITPLETPPSPPAFVFDGAFSLHDAAVELPAPDE